MSWDRAASDAFSRLLGYSQEYLNEVHKRSEEYQAALDARGFPPPETWEPASSSDSDSDDARFAPLSPPRSPRLPRSRERLDLSRAAWSRRLLRDAARHIDSRDRGFDKYETWRAQMISEHEQKALSSHPPPLKSSRVRRQCRCVAVSGRITRSKTSTATLFYELGLDGKIAQPLSTTFSSKTPKSLPSHHATRLSKKRTNGSNHRVQKN